MTLKTMLYERFNEKAYELFTDLSNNFPNIKQFRTIKSGILMMSSLDIKTPERVFKNFISEKFKTQILEKNDTFFLNHNEYKIEKGQEDEWNSFITEIKNIWPNLEQNNKDIIWKYFHILLVLSDKCNCV
jgi:neutral trehalase